MGLHRWTSSRRRVTVGDSSILSTVRGHRSLAAVFTMALVIMMLPPPGAGAADIAGSPCPASTWVADGNPEAAFNLW